MISFRQKGDFSLATNFFKDLKKAVQHRNLDWYAKLGVDALESATPVDTGKTATSWHYEIVKKEIARKSSSIIQIFKMMFPLP